VNRQQRIGRLITDVVVRMPALWPLFRPVITRVFDSVAPRWDSLASPHRMAAFGAALDEVPGEPRNILDIGTGTGDGAITAAGRWPAADVTGVDVSPEMVEEARRKAPELCFEVADASRLDFPEGAFDLVTMNNAIPFFGELARVVRPGGHLLIAFTLGADTPIYVAPERLRRGLRRAGFEVVAELAAGPGTSMVALRQKSG
jgi:SAM-dependent methyltransferase